MPVKYYLWSAALAVLVASFYGATDKQPVKDSQVSSESNLIAMDDEDDDPHREIHPKDIPTRKQTPLRQAEKDRKDEYKKLRFNEWPPGASDPYGDKDAPKGNHIQGAAPNVGKPI